MIKVLQTMYRTEMKLTIRQGDSWFFGILFPVGLVLLMGVIFGQNAAYEGADYSFMQQSLGAFVSVGIAATGLMGLPLSISDYRHKKILRSFFVTPVSPIILLIVQAMISLTIAIISAIMTLTVAGLVFGAKIVGSSGLFIVSYALVVLSVYSIGMFIASLAPNMKMANLLCTLVYFPMILLSGATVPYEVLPSGLQKISDLLPLTQGIKLMKAMALGTSPENVWVPFFVMSIIAVICIFLSGVLFKWE